MNGGRRRLAGLLAVAAVAAAAGCTSGSSAPTAQPRPGLTPRPTIVATAPVHPRRHRHKPRPRPTHAVVIAAPFSWHASRITSADLGKSWHHGCPLGPAQLRAISLTYWGFDRQSHHGTLVAATSATSALVSAFRSLYDARFPIRRMRPIAAYGGNDNRSMAHDNTSAFNCRYAVANGPKHWSEHAYGGAVDIDPLENPYLLDGKVLPPGGRPWLDRSNVRPGMVVSGSAPVLAFRAVGWGWGGVWSAPDYQHFSVTGN